MALLALIDQDKFDTLSEVLQAEYTKRGDGPFEGQYFLDVTQTEATGSDGKATIFALEDVKDLKGALQKERASVQDLTKRVKSGETATNTALEKLKELGDNPEASEAHKTALENLKNQLSEKHAGELKTVTDSNGVLENQMGEILVDKAVLSALSKHKLVEGGAELIMPHVQKRIKVVKNEGRLEAIVVDLATGQPQISMQQNNTGNMSIEELVETFSTNKVTKLAFAGKEQSGSTTPKDRADGKSETTKRDEAPKRDGIHHTTSDPADALMRARELEDNAAN